MSQFKASNSVGVPARGFCLAALVTLSSAFLAACGGGGGGGSAETPSTPGPLAGAWTMSVERPVGTQVATTQVTGSDVATLDAPATAAVKAAVVSGIFESEMRDYGATLTQSDGKVVASGSGTNYTIGVEGFDVTDYSRCNPCGVGSTVSFTVTTTLSEEGVVRGYPYPKRSYQESYKVVYTRTS